MDPTEQFMQQTGITDVNQAASLLTAAEGDVDLAVAIYQSAVTAKPTAATKAAPASKPKPKPTGGIVSFSSLTALDTGDDSDEDERQTYYAGGAKGSGVQVQDPRKKEKEGSNVAKVVEGVFDRARQGGARTDEEEDAEQAKPFQGSGYRLGNTNVDGPARAAVKPAAERLKKVITFYRNGFAVDDGPLREYSDKSNHAFLQDIQQGYIPRELEEEAAGRELQTELVDRKNEEYKEPERPKYNAFGGSGHSLGSASPSAPAPVVSASSSFSLDPSAPIVSIQIRFHDGTKAAAKVNATHTIMDLRAWIEQNKPTPGSYDLLAGFPPKPLTDANQTVQAAGLSGGVVQQKLR
jgi:UBX domain-containing protein 1